LQDDAHGSLDMQRDDRTGFISLTTKDVQKSRDNFIEVYLVHRMKVVPDKHR